MVYVQLQNDEITHHTVSSSFSRKNIASRKIYFYARSTDFDLVLQCSKINSSCYKSLLLSRDQSEGQSFQVVPSNLPIPTKSIHFSIVFLPIPQEERKTNLGYSASHGTTSGSYGLRRNKRVFVLHPKKKRENRDVAQIYWPWHELQIRVDGYYVKGPSKPTRSLLIWHSVRSRTSHYESTRGFTASQSRY